MALLLPLYVQTPPKHVGLKHPQLAILPSDKTIHQVVLGTNSLTVVLL
jgi:hypothetical protein